MTQHEDIIPEPKDIALHRKALEHLPPGHPHRTGSLNNLAQSLLARLEKLGRFKDLEEAIVLDREALELCPPGHPHRSTYLTNPVTTVQTRFRQLGKLENLEKISIYYIEGHEFPPPGHHPLCTSLIFGHSDLQEVGDKPLPPRTWGTISSTIGDTFTTIAHRGKIRESELTSFEGKHGQQIGPSLSDVCYSPRIKANPSQRII